MKGAKGGQRDKKVSKIYQTYNKTSIQEELEAIKAHRNQDGLNVNKDENGINNIENLEINPEELTIIPEDIGIKENKSIPIQKTEIPFDLQQEPILEELSDKRKENEFIQEESEEKNEMNFEDEKEEEEFVEDKKIVGLAPEETLQQISKEESIEQEDVVEQKQKEAEDIEIEEQEEYTKETELEQEILLGFEKMLKEDYYTIKDLEYQFQVLTQKEEDAVLQDEIEDLKTELEKLLEKFDAIKKKYEDLKNSKDFTDVELFDQKYLSDLVNNYKKEVQDNLVIDDLIKQIKETEDYIGIVEKIIYVEHEKDTLEEKIDEKKEEFTSRDTSFEELEEQYNDVEKINDEIEVFRNSLDDMLQDISKKIDTMGNITSKTETYTRLVPDMNRVFRAMAQFMAFSTIPRTRVGNIVRAGLMIGAIRDLTHAFHTERKTETKQVAEFVNYEKDILGNMTNIDEFVGKLDDATDTIKDMKQTFKEEIEEYASSIPEFKELLKNMEAIEKELEEKRYYLYKYNDDMKKELDRHNTKLMVYKNV